MKDNKNQKGITLIALIITIVILVILCGIAISEMSGDGILEMTGNMKGNADDFVGNTNNKHEEYLNVLKDKLNFKK